MENTEPKNNDLGQDAPKPIENDYELHKANPGPAEPAVTEKNENGAGKALIWVIPILVIALLIWWFIFRK
ncbi:hypothetical protein EZJ43_10820 [Pedobacter changchengzhani]|uniref:Uncharacterized protein n=1 Tax=Pedobacter changchengzhani TaxID=2529274 RepID=A0A4R5MJQ6_9SPHI|nr:hypothetical protein [Pedobacter changchengzhani]TDG35840.1 hypothetical protein EZJ43_10820 [Pedobacter changchengzhani]